MRFQLLSIIHQLIFLPNESQVCKYITLIILHFYFILIWENVYHPDHSYLIFNPPCFRLLTLIQICIISFFHSSIFHQFQLIKSGHHHCHSWFSFTPSVPSHLQFLYYSIISIPSNLINYENRSQFSGGTVPHHFTLTCQHEIWSFISCLGRKHFKGNDQNNNTYQTYFSKSLI